MKRTPPIKSQEHANQVGQLVAWAYQMLGKYDAPVTNENVLDTMRQHPEYDEVFKGMVLYPSKNGGGIDMFTQEEVLEGITLN